MTSLMYLLLVFFYLQTLYLFYLRMTLVFTFATNRVTIEFFVHETTNFSLYFGIIVDSFITELKIRCLITINLFRIPNHLTKLYT